MNTQSWPKAIIHLDLDAFYPAVEVLDNPTLKGKPVIVGGSRERGVVSSASYEARKFGVHSAQPMATAMRLCPDGIVLPVRMTRYKELSDRVFEIFHMFTPLVEPLSIDEAFLDVTGSKRLFGPPEDIAKEIKHQVYTQTGLTISAGIAPLKFVAKIASDMDKPDGLTIVRPDGIMAFLDPLPINKMWGAGKRTLEALDRLGIRTFQDLRQTPVEVLEKKFGRHGIKMHRLSRGMDERDVEIEHEVKSVGHEQTFSKDILDINMARKELLSLAVKVARRMRRKGLLGKTVTLKVKYSNFSRITRSITLPESSDDGPKIYATVLGLLKKTRVGMQPVRLLGVSLSQLSHNDTDSQLSLFEHKETHEKKKKLNTALDSLRDRFGEDSIRPGTLFNGDDQRT